jgi:hypothetical protein
VRAWVGPRSCWFTSWVLSFSFRRLVSSRWSGCRACQTDSSGGSSAAVSFLDMRCLSVPLRPQQFRCVSSRLCTQAVLVLSLSYDDDDANADASIRIHPQPSRMSICPSDVRLIEHHAAKFMARASSVSISAICSCVCTAREYFPSAFSIPNTNAQPPLSRSRSFCSQNQNQQSSQSVSVPGKTTAVTAAATAATV